MIRGALRAFVMICGLPVVACGAPESGVPPVEGRSLENGFRDERDIASVEALLLGFSHAYVTGDYREAARALSPRVVSACGGGEGLIDALARTHAEKRVDYAFYDELVPWRDDPRRADVIVVERWNGNQVDMPMGLMFARDGETWYLDELFPDGLSDYCDPLPERD